MRRFVGTALKMEIASKGPRNVIEQKSHRFEQGALPSARGKMIRHQESHSIVCTWLGILDNLKPTATQAFQSSTTKA